jgi:hypothetical protein
MEHNTSAADDISLGDDLLRGISAIAAFIGVDDRRAYYLAENKYIPVGKEGAIWIGLKSELRGHYRRVSQGAAESAQVSMQPRITGRRPARRRARPAATESTATA